MPKIVEIIGPSGAGKSTIYRNLKNDWEYEYKWVTYEQIKYSNESLYSKLFRRTKKVLKKLSDGRNSKVKKTGIVPEWGFISHKNRTFLGDKYSDFKTEVMDLVGKHCKVGFNGKDKRFITIYMIMWSIAYIETVKSIKDDDRFCILKQGEGLISRIMHLNSPSFDEEALKIYLSNIPFPDVIIFLDIEPEIIVERVLTRDRTSTLHDGMNENEILAYTKSTYHLLSEAADIAKKAGTIVHRVDVTKPIDDVVNQIKDILSN